MTDEPRPSDEPKHDHEHEHGHDHEHEGGATATAEGDDKEAKKLHQTVDIKDVGPCKKHIKVTVAREDIDGRLGEKYSELVSDANVAGFRPGKAPRKLVERRFQKEVGDQVKTEILLASLEQLAEENDIAPLSAPNIDPAQLEMPKDGPFVYEFEVEVRPEFDLPNYKGLKLKRPVHTFTDDEIEQEEKRLLAPYSQVVPKPEGSLQVGDVVIADVTTRDGARELSTMKETQFRVQKQLAFKDGVARKFGDQLKGANAGDTRVVDIELSDAVADPSLRGRTVQATFEVKDVKTLRYPELTHEFLHTFGVHTPEQLRELIKVVLERRLNNTQRASARQQVIEKIAATATWQLPEDLLRRQARKALQRRVMEMQSDGISEEEIAGRIRLLQQDILQSTKLSLQEHFVLQKIAEVEKIDVDEDDLTEEIERIADNLNESPRRIRARLEKEDMLDALAAEMIERKALDLILDGAEYEDVPLDQEQRAPVVETSEAQAVPGELQQPDAPPPEGEAPPASS
jgi:trigger factor